MELRNGSGTSGVSRAFHRWYAGLTANHLEDRPEQLLIGETTSSSPIAHAGTMLAILLIPLIPTRIA
jgi:hypothetical protein